MPENYYTDHISDYIIHEVKLIPDSVEIVSGKPIHLTREDGLKLLGYDFVNPLHVDRIIFSPPATIVFWKDGTKTVVKCADGEPFSEYNGFAAALLKKVFGSNSAVKKIIQRKKKYATPAKANSNSAKDADLEQRFKELVNEYEHLKNRAENLNLYLEHVRNNYPAVYYDMVEKLSGLPGFEFIVEEPNGN